MQDSIGALLTASAQFFPDKTALIYGVERWTFSELDSQANRVAAGLKALGVSKGDVVSLYAPNSPEWIVSYYGIMRAGAIANPLNLMLTASEACYAIGDCGAVVVLGTSERLESLAPYVSSTALRARISLDHSADPTLLNFSDFLKPSTDFVDWTSLGLCREDVSTIGYTSGTTGHPKGAVLTHGAILMNTAMAATLHMRRDSDTVVSALPLSHVYGNIVMNAAIGYGMTLVLHKTFDVREVLNSIELHRATIFEGVPTMYSYILDFLELGSYDLSSLTRCTVGGQTMPTATMERVEASFGCRLIELWGMTEIGGLGATHSVYGPRRLGSIGTSLPHTFLRVADPDRPDTEVPRGEVGELQVKGMIVMKSYWNRPDSSLEAMTKDGWLRSGDLARMDPDGFVYVVDRLKDMVITGGFNIYPAELERIIAQHPAVSMVAVGGIKDELKGELAKAYVVRCKGAEVTVAELTEFCRERLAAYKVPRAFQFVDDLPKTSSGKIMRRKLCEL